MNRYSTKEKTIALLAGDLSDPFTQRFCNGAMRTAKELGNVKLVIFPGKYIGQEQAEYAAIRYERQYNTLFSYPAADNVDGLIIILGALGSRTDRAHNTAFLEQFGGIPIVLATADYEDYVTVNYDNESGVREAMDYMINVAGLTRICMIGSGVGSSDAQIRWRTFRECLESKGLPCPDRCYAECDLSGENEAAAERILDRNPDAEAVFCANDEIARMFYRVMKRRGLIPGRDIRVLGFDNDPVCTRMEPALASIGADVPKMGGTALRQVLALAQGQAVDSVTIPTSLFVRSSLDTMSERLFEPILDLFDENHIDLLFDTVFYRYGDDIHSRTDVDLRRCFREWVSGIWYAVKNRYVDENQRHEINRMIRIFFENGALRYTDTYFLLRYVRMFQTRLNRSGMREPGVDMAAPFIDHVREQIALTLTRTGAKEREDSQNQLRTFQTLLGRGVGDVRSDGYSFEGVFKALGNMGVENALLYLYETPVFHRPGTPFTRPETMQLAAVYRHGSGYAIDALRQKRDCAQLFRPAELYGENGSMAVYPVFYEDTLYGLFLFDNVARMYNSAEVFSGTLGAAIHMHRMKHSS